MKIFFLLAKNQVLTTNPTKSTKSLSKRSMTQLQANQTYGLVSRRMGLASLTVEFLLLIGKRGLYTLPELKVDSDATAG